MLIESAAAARVLRIFLLILTCTVLSGQDAVPTEILKRTRLIRVGTMAGTGFLVDYRGRLYVVTAKHVVAGASPTSPSVEVWDKEKWAKIGATKILFPSSSAVDIAIIKTDETIAQPFQIQPAEDGGGTMGQNVWFLGYPFGDTRLVSHFADTQIVPFIKRATLSALDTSNSDALVVYLDGFNNPGFSGGPIVFWDFGQHMYRILAVVQGFRTDTAKVLLNGQAVDSDIMINSGILTAFHIKHAMEAVRRDFDSLK